MKSKGRLGKLRLGCKERPAEATLLPKPKLPKQLYLQWKAGKAAQKTVQLFQQTASCIDFIGVDVGVFFL
jgi:hypothetical protein